MKALFVDTSAWIALAVQRDGHHASANEFYPRALAAYPQLVTTSLVLAETYSFVRRNADTERTVDLLNRIRTSARVEVIYPQRGTIDAAVHILEKFSDHDLSLTDAVSFATMIELGISDAFAFDHYFSLAGFTLLPG